MGLLFSRRTALLLAVPVVLLAGAVFATASVERNAASHSASEQIASQSMLTAMLDQETGARGFFQTREPVFLQPYVKGRRDLAASVALLRSLLAGDPALQQKLSSQLRTAESWQASAAGAILTLERTGRRPSVSSSLARKSVMDDFRAAHAAFDGSLTARRDHSLSVATAFSVAVAFALAALLTGAGMLLARRLARRDEARQRDQSELREMLQASESEQDSRVLLIRHVERLLPSAFAAVFNRNNSDDRLEMTVYGADARIERANTAMMRPRSCLAVRLSRTYDHDPSDRGLLSCEICGQMGGTTSCEPLLVGGQVIGSVLVNSRNAIDPEHRARLRDSVAQAAPILANQRNLALAEQRAASDALTGLPNRRSADETLKRMVAHAGRSVTSLACILLDLDHFKALNDRYGHESGDKMLALVGRIIDATIRASDFAARFGGEEFLILLPETDREAAMIVAEKLRREIASAELTGVSPISASLGVAVLPTDAVESEELVRKADRSLYAAKEGGRNRIHSFSQPAPADSQLPVG